jgi:hypothetical protein
MASTIQIAYKDADGNVQYQNVSTSTSIINRNYNSTGSASTTYSIPTNDKNEEYSFENLSVSSYKKSSTDPVKKSVTKAVQIKNANSYPKKTGDNKSDGRILYDYTITIQKDILESIAAIKRNLNVPSAYTRLELNKLFHTQFNRFRVQYPDYFMNNTIGYVVFTRPDLNLFDSDGNTLSQVDNDSQLHYIMKANPQTAKTLTKSFSSKHHFNPLLSNTVMSLDVSDESIDTLETGETFTGYKTQYAKSNIRSMTAGSISLTFPETYNAAITHLHQLWCAYESGVYRGSLKPKDDYIWGKELDYACDIYYFLVDAEDMILRYWCKYTGCFPLNVNKSVFSYNGDTQINHPSLNVSYAYFAREDMSLVNLNEFNNNSSGSSSSFVYKANYIPDLGSSGSTWSGTPFIASVTKGTGFSKDAQLYALRFRPASS